MRASWLLVLLAACAVVSCSTISKGIRDRLPPPREMEGGIRFGYEAPAARMVTLAGNFNNWGGTEGGGRYDPTIDPMSDDDGDGIWEIVMPLAPGRYQYKFVIDNGVRWELDPSNPNTGVEGDFTNSLIIVPESVGYKYEIVTGTVLSGSPSTKTAGRTTGTAAEKEIQFTFDNPEATKVILAGDFNEWSLTAAKMEKDDEGVWRVKVMLKPGSYEYKFLVDDTDWVEDPDNEDTVPDPYGGVNSVITVE
ncbi:MAG: glycogen-binding domain-containing protein [Candidatus Eisenbacteria bacterium]